MASVSLDTGESMHPQKIHGSRYISICYPIIFTQELLIDIVHKQKITWFSPSQVLIRDWQKHINDEWFYYIIIVYSYSFKGLVSKFNYKHGGQTMKNFVIMEKKLNHLCGVKRDFVIFQQLSAVFLEKLAKIICPVLSMIILFKARYFDEK